MIQIAPGASVSQPSGTLKVSMWAYLMLRPPALLK